MRQRRAAINVKIISGVVIFFSLPCSHPAPGFFSGSKRSERDVGRSTSCVPLSRNSISCVLKCPLYVYQLHPELSTLNMTSCIPRLPRNRISCIEVYGYTKCPAIWRFLQFYCSLLYMNYMNTYRIVEWYRLCTVVSCYGLMFKPYYRNLFGEDDRHTMFLISPISSYCYDLVVTLSPEKCLMQ